VDHADIAHFAQTYGLAFMVLLFAIAIGYALWPKKRETFRRAARLPLEDD
jgi:cytochrome c oxidase cbb3-type subunit 4